MTVDLSEFKQFNGKSGFAGRCGPAAFVASMDETEQQQFAAAIADHSIQASAIHKWLQKRGYELGPETVRTHRKQGCACGRS